MTSRALKEIKISERYFELLSDESLKKSLRNSLVKQAPPEFFSVLTQATRHLLNGSFCAENPEFCSQFDASLYLIALPSTNKKDKQKVLLTESAEFIAQIYKALKNSL